MKLYSQDLPDFGTFATCLGGVDVTVAWKKHADHSVKADFSYLGTSYEFGISRKERRLRTSSWPSTTNTQTLPLTGHRISTTKAFHQSTPPRIKNSTSSQEQRKTYSSAWTYLFENTKKAFSTIRVGIGNATLEV